MLLDDKDPYQQLQWLADTLYAAEQNGEYVHIVTHVPPGAATTYDVCYREYHRIINRFVNLGNKFESYYHKILGLPTQYLDSFMVIHMLMS